MATQACEASSSLLLGPNPSGPYGDLGPALAIGFRTSRIKRTIHRFFLALSSPNPYALWQQ